MSWNNNFIKIKDDYTLNKDITGWLYISSPNRPIKQYTVPKGSIVKSVYKNKLNDYKIYSKVTITQPETNKLNNILPAGTYNFIAYIP